MDSICEIIQTLSKGDVNEFSSFINRQKQKTNRKDLELFLLFVKHGELPQNEIIKRLYPSGNTAAYHALRKKLLKHLSDFIFFKQLRNDDTTETQVSALVSMARYLSDFALYKQAWRNLIKAEQMADKAELYALANQIMRVQLEMPLLLLKKDIGEILECKKYYLQMAIEDDRADTAYKIIQHHLERYKTDVNASDVKTVIEQTLIEYQLDHTVSKRPSVVYRLMSIARSAAKSQKDYYSFEPLIMGYYHQIDKADRASVLDNVYMARIQYMIAHTLFRNKKFEKSLEYLSVLRKQLKVLSRIEYKRLLPKFTQLYCATRFFTGHISEAIRIADAALMEKLNPSVTDILNLKLNQAIYHFFNEDYKKAARILSSIGHSNAWCAKVAGVEWVIKKDILDIYIQFELGNLDIASNKLRGLLRQKQLFDKLPQLDRVKTYLQLVAQVVDDPSVAQSSSFFNKVEDDFDWIPIEQEDLHATVYYAWLKAKIVNQSPYSVLLSLISIEDQKA